MTLRNGEDERRNAARPLQPWAGELYRVLARVIYLATGLVLIFWFFGTISLVLLFLLLALIIAFALNPAVTWLEDRRVPRAVGTLIVCAGVVAIVFLIGWLIVPRLVEEGAKLAADLPEYAAALTARVSELFPGYPEFQRRLRLSPSDIQRLLPSFIALVFRVGGYWRSALGLVAFTILLLAIVIYMLAMPRPLLRGYVAAMPPHLRDPAVRAFARGQRLVIGWIWTKVIVGAFEGVCVAIGLAFIGVPGSPLWGIVTFFARLIPKLGPYLMSIPPTIVALAIDPDMALWTAVFFLALQAVSGFVLSPIVRYHEMELHPVSIFLALLAMGSAFGFIGAIIATPVTGFVKAIYEEFYLVRQPMGEDVDERVEEILNRQVLKRDSS